MARRSKSQEVLKLRAEVAKVRLADLAAEFDARRGWVAQAAGFVRSRPLPGLGVALAVGVALGLTRRRSLATAGPVVVRLLGQGASAWRSRRRGL
jgi:ElaB/YqjD/DUF883 family membrane-anchored ribosome-binding protein